MLCTVDTHRRGVRAGAGVVGTTAGSQRSGTRSTSGIAQCAARAIATTELVAEAAKNTLGSSCKTKQKAADSGKRSSGKGMGALLDQEAIRGTQHAKMKADTQETLQALEKTIEAMGDNENTTGVHNTHGKGMQRHSKEAQQRTDPWHFKSSPNKIGQRWKNNAQNSGRRTGSCKNISGSEEIRDATTAGRTQRAERSQCKRRSPQHQRERIGTVKNLGQDDMDVEEAGSEESLKDRELNLRRQA